MKDAEFNRPFSFGNYLYYINDVNDKLDHEVGDGLRARKIDNPAWSNDLRHQYVSAIYARNFGDKKAKQLGDMNELFNLYASGRYDTELDKLNNEIGRRYGLANPNISRSQLFEMLINDHSKNASEAKKKLKEMGF